MSYHLQILYNKYLWVKDDKFVAYHKLILFVKMIVNIYRFLWFPDLRVYDNKHESMFPVINGFDEIKYSYCTTS